MNQCPNCGHNLEWGEQFCTACGAKFNYSQAPNPVTAPVQNPMYSNTYASAPADPYDHTAEFDAQDVSDNKVVAMLIYLAGTIGIIIALFLNNSSKYVAFHIRQALKILVVEMLCAILSVFLCWTLIVPFAAGVMLIVLCVVKIICFFKICKGKSEEPPIVRNFNFLK